MSDGAAPQLQFDTVTVPPLARTAWIKHFDLAGVLRPSLLDIVYLGILVWLIVFTIAGNGMGLLVDASTGVHIRIGEYILGHGVPHTDFLSWTHPGEPWFAWEWLTDVLFAKAFQMGGLKWITLGTAAVIASSLVILFAHTASRGANVFIAVALLNIAVSTSSVHYLARPHVFTLLFFAISLWIIDIDADRPTGWLWFLVPLTALWANLHGGFAGLLATLAVLAAGSALQRAWEACTRYALVFLAALLASGLNPYGFQEHLHLWRYLNATWLRAVVTEFQQPVFDSSGGLYFELLFALAVGIVIRLTIQRDFARALMVAFWGHAALHSVRHVPILTIVLLPFVASELTSLWRWLLNRRKRGSLLGMLDLLRTLDGIAKDYDLALRRVSVWPLAATLLLASPLISLPLPQDFSDPRYPVEMARRDAATIAGCRHLFAPDNWGDYLLFHGYPQQRVFIDGRSDFYGEQFSNHYMDILGGHHAWRQLLDRYQVDSALVPSDSPIASLLDQDPTWRKVDQDDTSALFIKKSP
jgi:hypothetical protein